MSSRTCNDVPAAIQSNLQSFRYSWETIFVNISEIHNESEHYHSYVLENLESLTQYAFYIRTETYQSGSVVRRQGQTEIKYFKTTLETLTQVAGLRTISKTSTTITLHWTLYENEEELIRLYNVDVLYQPDDRLIQQRDFCEDPHEDYYFVEPESEGELCNGEKFEEDLEHRSGESREGRQKRAIANVQEYKYYVKSVMFTKNQADRNVYKIEGLKPFTLYAFQFFACETEDTCSPYAFHYDRTAAAASGDRLTLKIKSLENQVLNLKLTPSEVKNGEIVGFIIQTMTSTRSPNVSSICVPRHNMKVNSWSYYLRDLPAGLVKVRARAVSLAGLGVFTPWVNATIVIIEKPPTTTTAGLIWSVVVVLLILSTTAMWLYRRGSLRRVLERLRGSDLTQVLVRAAFDPNQDEEDEVIIEQMIINGRDLRFEND